MALPAQLLPGNVVGHYQILCEVGAGGMGVVFKAFDTKLERIVALKFLSHNPSFSSPDRSRLLHEARAASTLDHKNIATIHAVEEADDGQLFIVMAYYDGVSLASRMSGVRFSPAETVKIISQIAEGLAHAHLHHLVHRDIKPSNVILTPDGEAKIVDFGLAHFVSAGATTQTLSIAGTLNYMSPEQLSGKAVDARTDLWSLGVIAYELLTARLPFQGDSPAATISAILQATPPVMEEVPFDLQMIVLRALSRDVQDRYQSCADLLRDLQALSLPETHPSGFKGDPALNILVPLVLRSSSTRFRRFARRNRTVAWALAVLAVTLGAYVAPRLYRSQKHQVQASVAATPVAYESYLQGLESLRRYDKPENLNEAIHLFEATTKADPKFALAFAALGEAYWHKYRQDEDPHWIDLASASCKRAAELNSQLPAVYITLGRIHDGTGRHDLAVQEFQRALELDRHNPEAMLGLADAYSGVGRIQEAEDIYKKASAMRPENWDGYYRFGAFYFRLGRFSEAAAQFRRVIELLPDHAQAHTSLGTALMSLGQNIEAEAEYKKSLALAPDYPTFTNLGVLYYKQKSFGEAAATLEQALRLSDKDYRLWNNLAIAYAWLGSQDKVQSARSRELALLEQAFQIRSDDSEVRVNLGVLYSQQHLPAKALPHLEAALALSPDDPEVLNKAGEIYENLGDRTRAVDYFQKALQKGLTLEDLELNPDLRSLLSDSGAHRALETASLSAVPQQPSAKH